MAAVEQISERYRTNFDLVPGGELPLAVFERLIEKLIPVITEVGSTALYRRLSALPEETFGKSELTGALRTQLVERADQLLEQDAGNAVAHFSRGELRYADQDLEGAKADFVEALRLAPDHRDARLGLIRATLAERDDDQALLLLNDLLRLHPADELGLLERGKLWLRYFYVPEAMRDLEALANTTTDSEALLFIAKQLLFVGRPADAAAVAGRSAPSTDSLLVLGKASLELEKDQEAILVLNQALRLTIGNESLQRFANAKVSALKLLGDAHARARAYGSALDCYLEAMASLDGAPYDLRRAVAKIAWDTRIPDDGTAAKVSEIAPTKIEKKWIEPNMTAVFSNGQPLEISSADLQRAPYLERLPWTEVVERLEIGVGRRDNREAFVTLFQLHLPRLDHLDLQAEHFGFPCLFRLVAAPFFQQLKRLFLRQCDLDLPSLDLLLERTPGGLLELQVFSADPLPRLPRAITLADSLRAWETPSLRTLGFTDCALSLEEVMALTQARLPELSTLVLTGNDLNGIEIDPFLDSPLVQQLHEIRIGETGAEPALVLGLLDRMEGRPLKRIWAQRSWSEEELRAVKGHPNCQKLEQLELGASSVSEEMWLALLD